MPVYRNPEHGISQSEALAEAAVIAPTEDVVVITYELYHPLGTPDGPIYVVANMVPLSAKIEADADRNAGTYVSFIPIQLEDERPEESDSSPSGETKLTISNVGGILSEAVRSARESLVPWVLIERWYIGSDLSGPAQLPPSSFFVVGFDIDPNGTASLTCSYGDSSNVAVPKTTYKRSEYPGLVR